MAFAVRRVPPYFSMPLQSIHEVKPGSSLNITCVAGGSPMPFVKWRKGLEDLEPEHSLPIGRNILVLEDIQESANYTCVASSKLGQVENTTFVRVEGNVTISRRYCTPIHVDSSSIRLWRFLVVVVIVTDRIRSGFVSPFV